MSTPQDQAQALPGGVTVTRGVPPMRVTVNPDNTISMYGQSYGPGDEVLIAEGGVAMALELAGHVTVVERDASDAYHGKEGAELRKAAKGLDVELPARHEPSQQMDVTFHRQALARDHMAVGRQATEEDFE